MKRMVTACEPGENGVQRVWDFGGLELRDANYELKYVLQGTDTVIGTEHCTMYYYRTSGDSLFCLGYENPTTFIAYQKPELLLVFPVFQGRVVTDYFDGMGNYCERLEVWLRGKSTVTADASGVLILPAYRKTTSNMEIQDRSMKSPFYVIVCRTRSACLPGLW